TTHSNLDIFYAHNKNLPFIQCLEFPIILDCVFLKSTKIPEAGKDLKSNVILAPAGLAVLWMLLAVKRKRE
ncbi:unnamed protein product, partial [marine sediment metagenome]